MAEDCVDHAATLAKLDERPCVTRTLNIHGHDDDAARFGDLASYGSAAGAIQELMSAGAPDDAHHDLSRRLHPALPICAAQVVWAARREMARTVDDVLARRTRALHLNAAAAVEMAPQVARLLGAELGRDARWADDQVAHFTAMAARYRLDPPSADVRPGMPPGTTPF